MTQKPKDLPNISLRPMGADEWDEVAELIHLSTNYWYQSNGKGPIFTSGPTSARLFCEVYESLDPGCCIVAVNDDSKRIVGSCFYHPRPTHVSLGIMNVHPNYFGCSIASRLLKFVVNYAESEAKPVRLVSSAMNLDSYSLYTRAGFVPRMSFQDMLLPVPKSGLDFDVSPSQQVRAATIDDLNSIVALESELNHISREKDFFHFLQNESGIWHTSVIESQPGTIDGVLVSVQHPGSNMLGPGIMRTDEQAAALIHAELNHNRGRTPVFLIPSDRQQLVETMYQWGARNCELHFAQVHGEFTPPTGVIMPTFMPETG